MKLTKVQYGKNLKLNGIPVIYNTSGAKLQIGDNGRDIWSYDSMQEEVLRTVIVLLGRATQIFEYDFHEKIGTRPVGGNSIILKGTVLVDGCIVRAGAVVSRKFEDNCIIVGNLARVIKKSKRKFNNYIIIIIIIMI